VPLNNVEATDSEAFHLSKNIKSKKLKKPRKSKKTEKPRKRFVVVAFVVVVLVLVGFLL